MLRCISVLACLAFAAPCLAQEPTNVIVFLKSPNSAEVDPSVARSTGEKTIDSSWCRPSANLATFPWADELASVARGNTPVPLIHAILADPGGTCEYFVVYVSIYAVSPSLGRKLAAWQPTLSPPRDDKTAATASVAIAARPQALAAPPPPLAVQPEEPGAREAGPPPLPRPKPQFAAVKRIAAPAKPKAPAPGPRPVSPPAFH